MHTYCFAPFEGEDKLIVESTLLGTFTVYVDVTDDVDSICQAVSAASHIAVAHMDLYSR